MSVCIGLDIERETSGERNIRGGATLSEREREEKVDHTGHKETPTTRASPFIVHNTSLFTLHSKSDHVVYSNQLIATEALDKGLAKQKEKRFLQVGFQPLPPESDRGRKEEGSREYPLRRKAVLPQPNSLQGIYSLGFSRAG